MVDGKAQACLWCWILSDKPALKTKSFLFVSNFIENILSTMGFILNNSVLE